MQRIILIFNSIRYLKVIQIWTRVTRLVRRKTMQRFILYRLQQLYGKAKEIPVSPLILPDTHSETAAPHDFQSNTFDFLNRRVCLGTPIDWFPQSESQLWQYNLHYFNYVESLGVAYGRHDDHPSYEVFRRLAREWMVACPVAKAIAWDPYPTSLRINNWMKAYTWFSIALQKDTLFSAELSESIYVQAHHLENNLEYHVLGNHLIENGRALILAGLFFSGAAAQRWLRTGLQILWDELREQFLEDGGHYERSPMYHQIMLELYQETILILAAHDQNVPEWAPQRVQAMQTWLATVLHPDGQIALLNDAAFNVADPPLQPIDNQVTSPDGFHALCASGYFVFRDHAAQNFLLFDCGPLGPDYQPGHGHCDTLSYELSLNGQRFIVDTGVGNYYGDLAWRSYFRSTRAHNTVVIDGAEQSEIWQRFRVARRAYPTDVAWGTPTPTLAYVTGGHTGYHRLPGKVHHQRWVGWVDRRFWLICDCITGEGHHSAESLIHFHPAVETLYPPTKSDDGSMGIVQRGQDVLKVKAWGVHTIAHYKGETSPIQGWYAPEFGLQIKNNVWGLRCEGILPLWFGYILLPKDEDIVVQFSQQNGKEHQLTVELTDTVYHITCDSKTMALEKKA